MTSVRTGWRLNPDCVKFLRPAVILVGIKQKPEYGHLALDSILRNRLRFLQNLLEVSYEG